MLLVDESIEIEDRNRVVRLRIGIDNKLGRPYITLHDAAGLERLVLDIDGNGNGGMSFRTAEGQPILSLGVSSDSGMGMMLLDVLSDTCLTLSIADGERFGWRPSKVCTLRPGQLRDRPSRERLLAAAAHSPGAAAGKTITEREANHLPDLFVSRVQQPCHFQCPVDLGSLRTSRRLRPSGKGLGKHEDSRSSQRITGQRQNEGERDQRRDGKHAEEGSHERTWY